MRHYSVNWSIAAFLLLYVFAPSAYGGFYFTLFVIVLFAAAYLALKSIKFMQFNGVLIAPEPLLRLMALITLSVTITLSLNALFFSPIGLSDIAKPAIFMLFFVFGASSNLHYSMPEIKKTLVLVSKIIIVGQLVITADQILDINAFSVVYDYGKTSSTGEVTSFLRSTGSLFNPNYYGWILLQCAVIIYLFSKKSRRYFWLLLVMLMILASGSKSMTALYPLALIVAGWLKGDRTIFSRKNFYLLMAIVLMTALVYNLLNKYPDIFPRLNVLFALLSGEDQSGGGRYHIWETAYAYFLTKEEGVISWLFGMGPINEFKVLDNGYLYTFFRHGIVGLTLHFVIIFYFIFMFFSFEDRELGALGVQYVLIGALSELQVEGLAAWNYPIHLFLYAGIIFSYEYRRQLSSIASTHAWREKIVDYGRVEH